MPSSAHIYQAAFSAITVSSTQECNGESKFCPWLRNFAKSLENSDWTSLNPTLTSLFSRFSMQDVVHAFSEDTYGFRHLTHFDSVIFHNNSIDCFYTEKNSSQNFTWLFRLNLEHKDISTSFKFLSNLTCT